MYPEESFLQPVQALKGINPENFYFFHYISGFFSHGRHQITSESRLKLVYGAIPPEAMTLIYAAAKGISRSKPVALRWRYSLGQHRKPTTTKSGTKTKARKGKKLVRANVNPSTETGTVKNAIKNIIET